MPILCINSSMHRTVKIKCIFLKNLNFHLSQFRAQPARTQLGFRPERVKVNLVMLRTNEQNFSHSVSTYSVFANFLMNFVFFCKW